MASPSSSELLLPTVLAYLYSLKGSSSIKESEPYDIALQCLAEATKLTGSDTNEITQKYGLKHTLQEVFAAGLQALTQSATSATSTANSSSSSSTASSAESAPSFEKFLELIKSKGFFDSAKTPEEHEARMKAAKEKFLAKFGERAQPVEQKATEGTSSSSSSSSASAAGLKSASEVSESNKKEAERLKNEGNSFLNQGKYHEAAARYSSAIEFNPFSHIYFSNRAAAYINIHEYEKAETDCHSAIALEPSYPKAHYRLAQSLSNRQKYQAAIPHYEKALELAKDDENMSLTIKEQLELARTHVHGGGKHAARLGHRKPHPAAGAASAAGGDAGGAAGNNPFAQMMQNMGGMDFSQMMNSPAFQNMDFASLLSNPAIQQMAQQMFAGGANPFGGGNAAANASEGAENTSAGSGGSGNPLAGLDPSTLASLMNNPALANLRNDPEVAAMADDLKNNPGNLNRYLSNPALLTKITSAMSGGAPSGGSSGSSGSGAGQY